MKFGARNKLTRIRIRNFRSARIGISLPCGIEVTGRMQLFCSKARTGWGKRRRQTDAFFGMAMRWMYNFTIWRSSVFGRNIAEDPGPTRTKSFGVMLQCQISSKNHITFLMEYLGSHYWWWPESATILCFLCIRKWFEGWTLLAVKEMKKSDQLVWCAESSLQLQRLTSCVKNVWLIH